MSVRGGSEYSPSPEAKSSRPQTGKSQRTQSGNRDAAKLATVLKEVLNVPSPLSNYLQADKQMSIRTVRARCDLLKKQFVIKKLYGIREHSEYLDRWVNLVPHQHVVFAYDFIPQLDGSLLQITDAIEASRNTYEAIRSFKLNEINKEIPSAYIKFVTEYILQVSQTLFHCHQHDLMHGSLDLQNVIVQKVPPTTNPHGFNYIFRLTNFHPWVLKTFPFTDGDLQLLALLKKKQAILTKQDIVNMICIKDLYYFAISIIDLLVGKTDPQLEEAKSKYSTTLTSVPLSWANTEQAASIMEILSLCLNLDLQPLPLEKLRTVVFIAQRMYNVHFNPKYELPEGLDLKTVKGPLVKKIQQDQNIRMAEGLNDRAVLMYLRGDAQQTINLCEKALELNPIYFEAFLNQQLAKWKISQLRDDELIEELHKGASEKWPQPTANVLKLLIHYAAGYPVHEDDFKTMKHIDTSLLPLSMPKIIKGIKRYLEVFKNNRQSMLLHENQVIQQNDHVHHIYISNNERNIVLITCDAVLLLNTDPNQKPVKIELPTCIEVKVEDMEISQSEDYGDEDSQELGSSQSENDQDDAESEDEDGDMVKKSKKMKPTKQKSGQIKVEDQKEKQQEENPNEGGKENLLQENQKEGASKNQTLNKTIQGAVDDSGKRIVLQVILETGPSKVLTQDSIFVFDITQEEIEQIEGESPVISIQTKVNTRRLILPPEVAKEEIIYIRFIDEQREKVRVKTKSLKYFELLICEEVCEILNQGPSPLDTRSIFKHGEKYMEYFESLKLVIDNHAKHVGQVVLPENNTKIVAGYQSSVRAFFIYDIFLRRVIRSFNIKNPEFVAPLSIEEQIENSKKALAEAIEKAKMSGSKKSTKKITEAFMKDIPPPPKPFLDLEISDIRSFEMSPKGSYIIFNFSKFVFIQSLVVHEKLIKLVRPTFLSSRSHQYLLPKIEVDEYADLLAGEVIGGDNVITDIRLKISQDPMNLPNGIIRAYSRMVQAAEKADFEKSEANLEMAIYTDEAQNNPKALGVKDPEVVWKMRDFLCVVPKVPMECMKRVDIKSLNKFINFDKIQFQRSTEKITHCLFSSLPGNTFAIVAFGRTVHVYDFLKQTLLFKLVVANVTALFLLDHEEILGIQEGSSNAVTVKLYSIKLQTRRWAELQKERHIVFTKEDKERQKSINQKKQSGVQLIRVDEEDGGRGQEFVKTRDDSGGIKNVSALFGDDQDENNLTTCKVITFDEKVNRIITARSFSDIGYFMVITNTKFQVYSANVDFEDDSSEGEEDAVDKQIPDNLLSQNEGDVAASEKKEKEAKEPKKITLSYDMLWEVTFSCITQGLGRIQCLDVEDTCERLVGGTIKGEVALWEMKYGQFIRIVARDEFSIEHIRSLQKHGQKCLVVTSQPNIGIYDLAAGVKKSFSLPKLLGKCLKIVIERTESVMLATFTDRSLGIFNLTDVQFIRKISDLNFSRCFIDEACTYVVTADSRERALDFYWIQWDNLYVRLSRPPPKVEAVVVDPDAGKDKKIQKKGSSFCSIF